VRITNEIRKRTANGRCGYVHDRGRDFAPSIWTVDPAFWKFPRLCGAPHSRGGPFIINLVRAAAGDTDAALRRARRWTSPAPGSRTRRCATRPPRTRSAGTPSARPRAPTASRRHRPLRAAPHRPDRRRRATPSPQGARPAARHRAARRALEGRVRPQPRRCDPHQSARPASGSPGSSPTPCPAVRTPCTPRCGNSCVPCSPPTWRS
jgi:hypothetical protein